MAPKTAPAQRAATATTATTTTTATATTTTTAAPAASGVAALRAEMRRSAQEAAAIEAETHKKLTPPEIAALRSRAAALERRFRALDRSTEVAIARLTAEVWRHRVCNINSEAPSPLITNPLELAASGA